MEPSRKNFSAILIILLVVMASSESAFIGVHAFYCENGHKSGTYSGSCWSLFNDGECNSVCKSESSDNSWGYCLLFDCVCCK
ncbi:unnamed protein product [Urochloa decumbens]|uniref:Uncharacterized protein n=1 Tax=Urochloa decumbens TaxID=240449 RepID=A0ABC9ASJ8_9POAL